jgi:serine/threonine-protein kinase
VTAILSRGPERHQVPSLRGRTLDDAQATIQSARLSFGRATYAWSERVASGVVLAADPQAGHRLKRGAAVDLVVSKGPRPFAVPDLTGEDADVATKDLSQHHLEVKRSRENSDTVDAGSVISQTPDTGKVRRGDAVALVVSKGPVLVAVPEVRRMTAASATAALRDAGFRVRTERLGVYIGLGLVVKQTPGAGARAPKGSTITMFVV